MQKFPLVVYSKNVLKNCYPIQKTGHGQFKHQSWDAILLINNPVLCLHKPGKKCLNIYRAEKPQNFTISGCTSTNTYRPKYCGVCTDERCCIPYKSKTIEVDFQCPNGPGFTWQVMWINACFCNLSCKNPNDIFTDLEQYHEKREIWNCVDTVNMKTWIYKIDHI